MDQEWLQRFHEGESATLEACYQDHYRDVDAAVAQILHGVDRESVVHEVFFRLVSNPSFRSGFDGGSLGAWLSTVARNAAIDYLRARARHRRVPLDEAGDLPDPSSGGIEGAAEARLVIEKFRREILPAKWQGVFEARFVQQRDQRDAAAVLGIARTTLAYQELRIRALLRRFLLETEPS